MKFMKIVASALSASLFFGAAGVAEMQPDIRIPSFSASAADIVDSGECGDNAKWELDSEETLTISGTGEIRFSAFITRIDIKKVIIEKGITSIGAQAFWHCNSLESVTIPDSVTRIGGDAFGYTPWLEAKQKEDSLVVINDLLFNATTCSGDVTIPNNVKIINDYAFGNCKKLESVTIPDSVTSIGDSAFHDCSNITSITLPNSVKSIGDDAFVACEKLESIDIPDSVTDIGSNAFTGTLWLKAKQKENPLVIINGLLIDGNNCSGDVVIPDSVTSIVGRAFEGCTSLESITIPDSISSIGNKTFFRCTSLVSVTIPDSIVSIGEYAFDNCSSLESITILNPECEIFDSKDTICHISAVMGNVFNGTIKGYNGSTAEAYAKKYGYTFESLGDAPTAKNTYGDANCDGKVTVADAVAILQFIGNRDKYPLSDDGKKFADVDGVAGITGKDALVIQQVDAGLYKPEDLPLKA